jgi:hypothetical protein
VGSNFGGQKGSHHRSQATHGVGGRAGKLNGDSATQRSMAADNKRGCTWGDAILGAVETGVAVTQCLMGMGPALGIGHLAGGPWPTKSQPNFHS